LIILYVTHIWFCIILSLNFQQQYISYVHREMITHILITACVSNTFNSVTTGSMLHGSTVEVREKV